jgi:hypothetical protein
MPRGLLALLIACLPTSAASAPPACAAPRGFEASGRIESSDVVVLFRTVPAAIEVGRHFSVEVIVCAGPPAAVATDLRIDAQMPEHRHGMNYRPRVVRGGEGVYVAEGFLFHMPGRWQLLFDVERGGRTDRLSTDIVLE